MKISEIIIDWYKKNQRILPWRNTNDPYCIWISEIILQQTRVSQGIDYYNRFVKSFPDVHSLAAASEQDVIKLWQGLGYYSRARNLHAAARQIVEEQNGIFPNNFKDLLKLKGVGPYTAAAISSIAFNEPVAAVDGNVIRVISRLFAITEAVNISSTGKKIDALAKEILDETQASLHNQAMMEFGALQCVPVNPDCLNCPLKDNCMAFDKRIVKKVPLKVKKTEIRERFFIYLILVIDGSTFLHQRLGKDIWKQMFEFPMIEMSKMPELEALGTLIENHCGLNSKQYRIKAISKPVKHILSHQKIHAQFIHIDVIQRSYRGRDEWVKLPLDEISRHPIPRLIDRYLESNA